MSLHYDDGKLRLHTLLGDYPKTRALREGRIASDLVELDIADIASAPSGFKPLVRDLRFDVAEVAIVTFLQARAAGKPYVLLPIVINGNFHHGSMVVRTDAGIECPTDLEGKRIGVRMYSQTTPTWVRGFLQNDYGVNLDTVKWVTFEDPHVVECTDPPGTERAAAGKTLADMLLAGEVDAAMMGQGVPDDPHIRPFIADPQSAAAQWQTDNGGAVPINHMMCVRAELAEQRPDVVQEIFRMILAARDAMDPPMPPATRALQPYGFANLRTALELANKYAYQQGLIPRPFAIEELFDARTILLGSA